MRSLLGRGTTRRMMALIGTETLLIVASVYAAWWIRFGWGDLLFYRQDVGRALLIAVITQFWLYLGDLYDFHILSDRREMFVRAVQALGATSLTLAAVYYWFEDLMVGRGVFMLAAFFVVIVVFGWRVAFEWTARRVGPRERLLLVGTGEGAVRLARELFGRKGLGIEIVGFIDPDPAKLGAPVINPAVIGTIEDIPAIVRARSVDQVVVSLSDARGMLPMDKLLDMKLEGVSFSHLATVYEKYTGKIAVENLRPSWLIFSEGFKKSRLQQISKRTFDVVLSLVGVLLALPIMLLVAIAIKLSSRGPVFYHQDRVGLHGRVFTVHKFRSMRQDAEKETGAVWAQKRDNRITTIGRLIRRTRFDELPQLWNVLCGHMSVVGPRPERPEFVSSLKRDIRFYGQRHTVRPGLTGWAQVRYTYGASVEDAMEKLQFDLFYIKHMSLSLDLFIMAKTVKTVLVGAGAH